MRINYFFIFCLTLFILYALSCQNNVNDNAEKSQIEYLNQYVNSSGFDKKNHKIEYIKGPAIVFFSINEKQYKDFIFQMGADTKWEFDIIYNNFKRIAENTKESLEANNIKYLYTTENITGFIGNKNDTFYFNKTGQDYFIGQVLFNGADSVYISEGLYNSEKLKSLIIDFFKIENDFNIQYVPEISDSFRYYMPDTNVINSSDTLQ